VSTFYVDINAATGGDGSSIRPFRLIGEAMEAMSFGDHFFINDCNAVKVKCGAPLVDDVFWNNLALKVTTNN